MAQSKIIVEIDFIAGINIRCAINQAIEKTNEWKVAFVNFSFNGVSLSVNQNSDINKVVEEYEQRLKKLK